MKGQLNRRSFLEKSSFGALIGSGLSMELASSRLFGRFEKAPVYNVDDTFPSQDIASVREIVGAAHARFERVKELVESRPELAKATYDWGYGDWESALGAASHMGRKDIAELLLEYGARPNIFTFAMLGKVEAIQSMVEASPGIQRIRGPHGITLLAHARNRLRWDDIPDEDRRGAQEVVEYLEALGNADENEPKKEISEEEKNKFLGFYDFGGGDSDYFEVALNRGGDLTIKRGNQTFGRRLNRVETNAFAPGGAPSVRIRFKTEEGRAIQVSIHDPDPVVTATLRKA